MDPCINKSAEAYCRKSIFIMLLFLNSIEMFLKIVICLLIVYLRRCLTILENRINSETNISLLAAVSSDSEGVSTHSQILENSTNTHISNEPLSFVKIENNSSKKLNETQETTFRNQFKRLFSKTDEKPKRSSKDNTPSFTHVIEH